MISQVEIYVITSLIEKTRWGQLDVSRLILVENPDVTPANVNSVTLKISLPKIKININNDLEQFHDNKTIDIKKIRPIERPDRSELEKGMPAV